MTQENSPKLDPSAAANPEGSGTADAGTGTAKPSVGEATSQGAPAEETFYSGDPNTLPQPLRESYNNMLTDYKKKTANLSEQRKEVENIEKHAKTYQALLKDKDFVEYWQNRASKMQGNGQQRRLPFTEEEFRAAQESPEAFYDLVSRVSDNQTESLQNEVAMSKMSEIVSEFAEEVDDKGVKLRPLFYDLEDLGLISQYMAKSQAEDVEEYAKNLFKAYDWAKSQYEKVYNKGKSEAMASVGRKVGHSTLMPGDVTASGEPYQGKDPKTLTTREAMELAKQGKTVPRG